MGNPHCVIFVDDAVSFRPAQWGPLLETHPLFPRKTNVEFVTVASRTSRRHARLGAGRGSDAGVRHGRLRDAGRVGARRPDRPDGDRFARRAAICSSNGARRTITCT